MDWIARLGAPHRAWLVLALMVQRDRQRWHHEVCARISDEDEGDVPDLPGWTYERHGIGVCLYAPDGERLDVDFDSDGGAIIDVWFFAARVASLGKADAWLAERRLWRWRPMREVIVDGIAELVDLGHVTFAGAYTNKIRLAPELEARAGVIAAELAEHQAAWLARIEPEGEAAYLADHRAWARDRLRTSERPGDVLELALDGASVDETLELVRPFLARRDWAAGHAIELVRARPELPVMPEIAAFLRRASVDEDHPYSPYQAMAYLFERGIERELASERLLAWAAIDKVSGYNGHPYLSNLAVLALREVPDRALAIVRRVLSGSVPACVHEMAALLAAIDQRWCHRELAAALEQPRRASHAYLAAALRCTSSDLARRRAALDPGPPERAPGAIGYTFDEVLHARADDEIGVEKWRELAAELRTKLPDDYA